MHSQKDSSCLNHFYLTITFTFLRIFPDFTVIQAVPFFFPVITPLELTVVFCTVIEMTCFLTLASVMVTLAFPAFKPFIVPLLFTETIFLLLEVQLLTESPFANPETFIFEVDCFTFSLMLVAVTLIVGVSFLLAVLFSLQPLLIRICTASENNVLYKSSLVYINAKKR